MITANIGKIFLDAYNQREGKTYTAENFFEKEFFKLFYDNEKYMQWVINSPFVQNIKKEVVNGVKGKLKMPTPEDRQKRLQSLKNKIEEKATSNSFDASVAIGFPASKLTDTTSGQVSNLILPFDKEDAYLSWIGSGLGIEVKGQYSILFNHPEILLAVFDGWKVYRNSFLSHPAYVKTLIPNQVDRWNGQWLSNFLDPDFIKEYPLRMFNPIEKVKDKDLHSVSTQSWFVNFFKISSNFSNTDGLQLIAYVCSLGKINKSIGFIPIDLPAFHSLRKYYKLVCGIGVNAPDFLSIYKTENDESFITACTKGRISLDSLVPKDLSKYFVSKGGKLKSFNLNKEENYFKFLTYKTWLLAMLNKEEMQDFSVEVANALLDFREKEKDGRSIRSNEVNRLFEATSKAQLLKCLIIIVDKADLAIAEIFKKFQRETHFMTQQYEWQYLLLLVRFEFVYAEKNRYSK